MRNQNQDQDQAINKINLFVESWVRYYCYYFFWDSKELTRDIENAGRLTKINDINKQLDKDSATIAAEKENATSAATQESDYHKKQNLEKSAAMLGELNDYIKTSKTGFRFASWTALEGKLLNYLQTDMLIHDGAFRAGKKGYFLARNGLLQYSLDGKDVHNVGTINRYELNKLASEFHFLRSSLYIDYVNPLTYFSSVKLTPERFKKLIEATQNSHTEAQLANPRAELAAPKFHIPTPTILMSTFKQLEQRAKYSQLLEGDGYKDAKTLATGIIKEMNNRITIMIAKTDATKNPSRIAILKAIQQYLKDGDTLALKTTLRLHDRGWLMKCVTLSNEVDRISEAVKQLDRGGLGAAIKGINKDAKDAEDAKIAKAAEEAAKAAKEAAKAAAAKTNGKTMPDVSFNITRDHNKINLKNEQIQLHWEGAQVSKLAFKNTLDQMLAELKKIDPAKEFPLFSLKVSNDTNDHQDTSDMADDSSLTTSDESDIDSHEDTSNATNDASSNESESISAVKNEPYPMKSAIGHIEDIINAHLTTLKTSQQEDFKSECVRLDKQIRSIFREAVFHKEGQGDIYSPEVFAVSYLKLGQELVEKALYSVEKTIEKEHQIIIDPQDIIAQVRTRISNYEKIKTELRSFHDQLLNILETSFAKDIDTFIRKDLENEIKKWEDLLSAMQKNSPHGPFNKLKPADKEKIMCDIINNLPKGNDARTSEFYEAMATKLQKNDKKENRSSIANVNKKEFGLIQQKIATFLHQSKSIKQPLQIKEEEINKPSKDAVKSAAGTGLGIFNEQDGGKLTEQNKTAPGMKHGGGGE